MRTVDADGARSVVLLSPRLAMLCFRRPRFDVAPDLGRITWPIEDGALVSSDGRGHGYLRLELRRARANGQALLRTEVEGYRPRLAHGRLGTLVYAQTQLRLHETTMDAFLRSLAATLTG